MRYARLLVLTAPLALLAACGDPGDDSDTVGALTADEAKQLNDAAAMLDVGNRPPLPANTLSADSP